MNLKKLDPQLLTSLQLMQLTQANKLQQNAYSIIKSGANVVIIAPKKSGKTINSLMHVVQKLRHPGIGSTQVLFVVSNNQQGQITFDLMQKIAKKNQLQIYFSNEKADFDEDKNMISVGNDVLIGTIKRINDLFGSAGFNLNTVKFIVIDDLDEQLFNRLELQFQRLLMSIEKNQFLINAKQDNENVFNFVNKYLTAPYWVKIDEE